MLVNNTSGGWRLASPPNRRIVKLDKKNHEDVIAIIENLNNEQWGTLTKDFEDVTRVDFAKICVGIVQHLTDTTYKNIKLAIDMMSLSQKPKEDTVHGSKPSATAALRAPTILPPLESPQGNAVVAEIVQEVKLALSAALDNRVSGNDTSSATTEGWSALFLTLEEDISSALRARLDSSDFIAQKTKASCPSSEDLQMDSEAKDISEERSTPQPENAGATSTDETSSKEEEVTTACTNEVISQMFDAYQLAELEEQRLRAASERESEVSLLTDHFVDSVMIELKELASSGKISAFQWIPKDVLLPAVMASCAADQEVFSPQFQIIAQQKVQEVLIQSESLTGDAPSGHAPSAATDIVGALVRGLSGTLNSTEGDIDTSGSAQHIYQGVQDKVKSYLWGTKPAQDDSDSQLVEDSDTYDTGSSAETSEDDSNLASSEDGASLSSGWSKESQVKARGDVSPCTMGVISDVASGSPHRELEKKHSNNVARSRSTQLTQTSPFLEKKHSDNVARSPSSPLTQTSPFLEKKHSDNVARSQSPQPTQTSPFLEKKHTNNIARSQSPKPTQTSPFLDPQSSLSSSPMQHQASWRNRVRKFLCCSSQSETVTQTKDEDTSCVSEARTSSSHDLSEAHVSDIIVIMDREDTCKQSGSLDSDVDSLPNTPETF